MSRLIKIVATLAFAAPLFWLILVNRGFVDFSLEPFIPDLSISLAVIIFGSVFFGFLWGALIVWLNGSPLRSELRRQKKELKKVSDQSPSVGSFSTGV